ncbi:MAG: polysaccharide deacetylase [Crocinitomicaceae bacterium]|jgi:peptidoglycan/xylan/chitin deacetylase (PgdA/CDA1 family)|nr:polysaccharide deacetylase [Crocinitomicaceae bacterium]
MRLFRIPKLASVAFPRRIWGFFLDEKSVYLTFDDGPHPDITPFVLDTLKESGVKATFFCVGENVKRYPEIFARIKAEGHQVGNHTQQHENASKTSPERYLESVTEADGLIQSRLFRPPYGRLSPRLARILAKDYKIVMWTWLSYDFDPKTCVTEILFKAEKQIRGGDIIVLHDNPKIAEKQKELLPKLLDLLQKRDFQFRIIR